MPEKEEQTVSVTIRIPTGFNLTLESAMRATGASKTDLVLEATQRGLKSAVNFIMGQRRTAEKDWEKQAA